MQAMRFRARTAISRRPLDHESPAELHRTRSPLIDNWQLGEAGRQLYDFLWSEYCDWYIEAAKARLYGGSPAGKLMPARRSPSCSNTTSYLLHPFMPFVTEAIWQNLPELASSRALIVSRWPRLSGLVDEARRGGLRSPTGRGARHPQRAQ